MKKLIFVISVLLIALACFLQFKNCPHVWRRITATILHKKYVPAADIVFHRTRMAGYGSGPRGSTQGGSSVTGSDCVTVGWSNYKFPTAHDADEQFQEWVHKATRIVQIEHSNSMDRAVFENSQERQPFHVISKKENSAEIVAIWSDSLEHALLYEREENAQRIRD
jgi:hypothetical protein